LEKEKEENKNNSIIILEKNGIQIQNGGKLLEYLPMSSIPN